MHLFGTDATGKLDGRRKTLFRPCDENGSPLVPDEELKVPDPRDPKSSIYISLDTKQILDSDMYLTREHSFADWTTLQSLSGGSSRVVTCPILINDNARIGVVQLVFRRVKLGKSLLDW